MRKIELGIEKSTGKSVAYSLKELGNVLIAGTCGSGKSIFLRNVAKSLISEYKPGEIGFIVFDEKGLDYRFLRDDPRLVRPIGRDLEDFSELLTFLEKRIQLKGAEGEGLSPLVVVIDEFASVHFDKNAVRRLEFLMDKGPSNQVYFLVATQCPTFYTKAMYESSRTKLALHHSEVDGRLFCAEPRLPELCPNSGDGLLILRSEVQDQRLPILVRYGK